MNAAFSNPLARRNADSGASHPLSPDGRVCQNPHVCAERPSSRLLSRHARSAIAATVFLLACFLLVTGCAESQVQVRGQYDMSMGKTRR